MDNSNYITLTVDNKTPIEVKDFVGILSALNNQFEKYIKANFPETQESAKFYITEVRKGSAIIDILPNLLPLVEHVQNITIIDDFVTKWVNRIKSYLKVNGRDEDISKSDLKDILDTVKAISIDPNSRQKLERVTHIDGERKTKTMLEFNSKQAAVIYNEASQHLLELNKTDSNSYVRQTMFFQRSSTSDASIGKPSGERVVIDAISSQAKPLIYASELAERKIKDELNHSDDNPYKKAFIVDVNVEIRNEKPWAYRLTHIHQIIPLDEE